MGTSKVAYGTRCKDLMVNCGCGVSAHHRRGETRTARTTLPNPNVYLNGLRPVPAPRHDLEMDNFIYEGRQGLDIDVWSREFALAFLRNAYVPSGRRLGFRVTPQQLLGLFLIGFGVGGLLADRGIFG